MTDVGVPKTDKDSRNYLQNFRWISRNEAVDYSNRHVFQALERNKREGLTLAVRARWIALCIIAVLLVFIIPSWDVLFYEAVLVGLALIGWLQLRAGKVGRSGWELTLIFMDIALMTVGMLVPNPFLDQDWPSAIQFQFNNFKYFYVFLAAITLGYSWRTVISYGTWAAVLWLLGMVLILFFGTVDPELTDRLREAALGDERLLSLIDPSRVGVANRIEEVTVFLIVAGILAVNSFRMNQLLLRQASTTRERTNLARHFPPNIVDQLAERDQPLGTVREQDVAVMFADIVGFTRLAEKETPEAVVAMLRDFHQLIEETVFEHGGTLDKYLGDGVMVTFGTPEAGKCDACDAISCAEALFSRMDIWNDQRSGRGEARIKLSIGLHYGSVILGDIGTERRLEFATLGDAVNVASRLEELTRPLGTVCVLSDDLVEAAKRQSGATSALLDHYSRMDGVQPLRGRDAGIVLWIRKMSATDVTE
tara:strand:- start:41958 stop:43394 length:1437 start_codon:yes stop_codon:yes gene_type:complete